MKELEKIYNDLTLASNDASNESVILNRSAIIIRSLIDEGCSTNRAAEILYRAILPFYANRSDVLEPPKQ